MRGFCGWRQTGCRAGERKGKRGEERVHFYKVNCTERSREKPQIWNTERYGVRGFTVPLMGMLTNYT